MSKVVQAIPKTVKITIDGLDLNVTEGSLLIDAALNAGIRIPHLCYCPGLDSVGACRLCVVEIEGEKKLITSCTRRVKDGMVVRTSTEKVREARRFVTELILSNHPGDCLSCDKNGHCELQQCAYDLGIESSRFAMKSSEYVTDVDEFITRNYDLCVLCGRCVRACSLQGSGVLDFMKRGMPNKVTTPLDKPLKETSCSFCGSCISVCPVAALMESDRRFKGQEWELSKVKTVCSYCGCACELIVSTRDGLALKSETENPTEFICARGKFGWDFYAHPDRLRTPLVKKGGKLIESTWEEALDLVAKKLSSLKKKFGPDAIGGIAGAGLSNETLYLFQKLFRVGLGTNNIDGLVRLYGSSLIPSSRNTFGIDSLARYGDIEESDVLLLIGVNVTEDYPLVGALVKKAVSKGAKIITIDPISTKIAKLSHLHLKVSKCAEGELLDLMAKAIVKEKIYDAEFVKKCKNFNEYKKYLGSIDIKCQKVGVPNEDVLEAVRLFADKAAKCTVLFPAEMDDDYALQRISNLLLLCGRTERAVFPCILLNNLWGTVVMGVLPDHLPGVSAMNDSASLKKFSHYYGSALPDSPGLTCLDMVAKGSNMKAIYILSDDPLAHFPNWKEAEKSLSSLEFLVVQTDFATKITQLADVVLPASNMMESAGTYFAADGSLRRSSPAIRSNAKQDWQILAELLSRLDVKNGYDSEMAVKAEIDAIVPLAGNVWTGKGKEQEGLFSVDSKSESCEKTSSKFPFRLVVGGTSFASNIGSLSAKSKLKILEPCEEGYFAMNSGDLKKLGLKDGSKVKVSSRISSLSSVAVIDDDIPAGLVLMPRWFAEAHALRSSELDKAGKLKYRSTAVSVEKVKK